MYKSAFFLMAFCVAQTASSQLHLTNAANGEVIREMHYTNYKGSPYLFSDWVTSSVKIGDKQYQSVLFNVDMHANKVLYKSNDSIYAFRDAVNEFTVMQNNEPILYKRGHLLNVQLSPAFVEVLSLNPLVVKLLKVNVVEQSSYGASTKEFRFVSAKEYYVQDGNGIRRIKLSKDEAKKVFGDKWDALEKKADKNDITLKSEEGWRWLGKNSSITQ